MTTLKHQLVECDSCLKVNTIDESVPCCNNNYYEVDYFLCDDCFDKIYGE